MSTTVKNFLKAIGIVFLLLFIFSSILNLLYYYDVFNNNFLKYIKMLLSILSFFIGGVTIGKNSVSKGYINGLKLSGITVLLLLIFGIIFNNLNISRIIYYFILSICITFGAMVGISKNEN